MKTDILAILITGHPKSSIAGEPVVPDGVLTDLTEQFELEVAPPGSNPPTIQKQPSANLKPARELLPLPIHAPFPLDVPNSPVPAPTDKGAPNRPGEIENSDNDYKVITASPASTQRSAMPIGQDLFFQKFQSVPPGQPHGKTNSEPAQVVQKTAPSIQMGRKDVRALQSVEMPSAKPLAMPTNAAARMHEPEAIQVRQFVKTDPMVAMAETADKTTTLIPHTQIEKPIIARPDRGHPTRIDADPELPWVKPVRSTPATISMPTKDATMVPVPLPAQGQTPTPARVSVVTPPLAPIATAAPSPPIAPAPAPAPAAPIRDESAKGVQPERIAGQIHTADTPIVPRNVNAKAETLENIAKIPPMTRPDQSTKNVALLAPQSHPKHPRPLHSSPTVIKTTVQPLVSKPISVGQPVSHNAAQTMHPDIAPEIMPPSARNPTTPTLPPTVRPLQVAVTPAVSNVQIGSRGVERALVPETDALVVSMPLEQSSTPAASQNQQARAVFASGPQVTSAIVQAAGSLVDRPVELILNPEELGRVRLTLHSVDGSMSVNVAVERAETLELLRKNIDMLAEQLRDIGYQDLSFSFAGENDASQDDQDAHDPDSQQDAMRENLELQADETQIARLEISPTNGIDIRL